jgi:protein-disulfide isomerase
MDEKSSQNIFMSKEDDLFKQPLKKKKPFYKRWWFIAYVAIFIVSVGILIVFTQRSIDILDKFFSGNIFGEVGSSEKFTALPQDAGRASSPQGINPLLLAADDDPTLGNPDASLVLVEFADFQCPFCRESFPILRELLIKYPNDVYFIYKDFPVEQIHPLAFFAAQAGQCALEQNRFWPLHDKIYINQDRLSQELLFQLAREVGVDMSAFTQCMQEERYAQEVADDFQAGLDLGVSGTPTFFVNGRKIAGVVPQEAWEQIVEFFVSAREAPGK